MSGSLFSSVALTLDDDLVGIVGEPVERTLGEDRIVKQWYPFLDRAVRRDNRGRATVPLDDHLVEITRLQVGQAPESEIVNNEHVRFEETPKSFLSRMIGSGLVQELEHPVAPHKSDIMSGPTGRVPER